ncbi:MAG: hypothetical protein HY344_03445 [Candidatus Levybacteria bacterium]|nr:hypothetical protein [Candidatus Levybacteria bacterium]
MVLDERRAGLPDALPTPTGKRLLKDILRPYSEEFEIWDRGDSVFINDIVGLSYKFMQVQYDDQRRERLLIARPSHMYVTVSQEGDVPYSPPVGHGRKGGFKVFFGAPEEGADRFFVAEAFDIRFRRKRLRNGPRGEIVLFSQEEIHIERVPRHILLIDHLAGLARRQKSPSV